MLLEPNLFSVGDYLQGGSKKSLRCDLEEKCLRNSKIFFDRVFLSIYSYLKILKMACSKLVRIFLNNLNLYFSFFKLITRKLLDHKEILFLFYIAKSISFEVMSI